MMKRNLRNCVSFQSFGAITVSGKVRAAWYVTGTIRVAVCNRIFTRSLWLVSGSKFAAKGGRRKKRRTKSREAGGGGIFETPPRPVSWLNEFTCLLIPLERWITSAFWGGEGGKGDCSS